MSDSLVPDDEAIDDGLAAACLARLAAALPGVVGGVVAAGDASLASVAPMALWPPASRPSADLARTAEAGLREQRGVVVKALHGATLLAFPFHLEDCVKGAVAVEMGQLDQAELRRSQEILEACASALVGQLAMHRLDDARRHARQSGLALEVLVAALDEEGFEAAGRGAVMALAAGLGCRRVSLGFVRGEQCRPVAISHSAGFGRGLTLAKDMSVAMDEAVEQRASLIYPPTSDNEPLILTAQATLAARYGAGSILTVPLFLRDRYVGAMVAERDADMPFDQASVDLLACVGALLAPALLDRRDNDRWLWAKIASTIHHHLGRMLGPGHLGRKLALLVVVGLVVVAWFARGQYEVVARARVEGLVERAIVAPFDGYIREAEARPGDLVAEGALLAKVDDRDLVLERLNWVTERQQDRLAYERALADRDRAEANVVRARIEKAEAQIALADALIARTELRAPFRGLVVAGDLSRAVGAVIRRGDLLFRLAPLDAYRVVVQVDESQIADVDVGQTGRLLLAALPDRPLPIVVDRITPLAEVADGRTVFHVEAALDETPEALRPGLEGVARIDVDQRRIVWIWSRTLIDWLRLATWSWLP